MLGTIDAPVDEAEEGDVVLALCTTPTSRAIVMSRCRKEEMSAIDMKIG